MKLRQYGNCYCKDKVDMNQQIVDKLVELGLVSFYRHGKDKSGWKLITPIEDDNGQ